MAAIFFMGPSLLESLPDRRTKGLILSGSHIFYSIRVLAKKPVNRNSVYFVHGDTKARRKSVAKRHKKRRELREIVIRDWRIRGLPSRFTIYDLRFGGDWCGRQRKYGYFRLMILPIGVIFIIYKEKPVNWMVNGQEISTSGWTDSRDGPV